MQYSLPQFVDVEDKIIGPLTLKQFLILLFGGLICFFYWSILSASGIFFVLALPTMGFFTILAFGKFNGRPVLSNIPNVAKYFLTSKRRIFQRTTALPIIKKQQAAGGNKGNIMPQDEVQSRLRSLAYILDQKTAEEERLIHSGQLEKKWISEI